MSSAAKTGPGPPHIDCSEEGSAESFQGNSEEEGEEVRVRETVHVGSRCGRDVSIRTIESFYPDGSRSVVTATTDSVTRYVTIEATKYPAPMGAAVDQDPGSISDGTVPCDESRTTLVGSQPSLSVDAEEGAERRGEAAIGQAPAQAAHMPQMTSASPEVAPPSHPMLQPEQSTRDFRKLTWRRKSPKKVPGGLAEKCKRNGKPKRRPRPSRIQRHQPTTIQVEVVENAGEPELDESCYDENFGSVRQSEGSSIPSVTDRSGDIEVVLPSATPVSDQEIPEAKLVETTRFKIIIFGKEIRVVYLAALFLVIVGIAVSLSVTFGHRGGREEKSAVPSVPATPPPTNEMYGGFLSILGPVSGWDAFNNDSSFQSKALTWLIEDDKVYSSSLSSDRLVQRYVLLLLYLCAGGGDWSSRLNFATASVHECDWHAADGRSNKGTFCHASNQTVTRVELAGNNLQGSIPKEISELHGLAFFSLSSNSLEGEVPIALGELSHLIRLDLSDNNLIGNIPASFGNMRFLERLNLENNGFNGVLPSELANLTSLVYLNMRGNNFTGSIDFLCLTGALIDIDCLSPQNQVGCSCCPSCPSVAGCAIGNFNVRLDLRPDDHGVESTWDLMDARDSSLLFTGGPYGFNVGDGAKAYSYDFCLDSEGNYTFTFKDSYGDGMRCGDSACGYNISANSKFLASVLNFGTSSSVTIGSSADGIYFSEMCYADDIQSPVCPPGTVHAGLTLKTDNFGSETGVRLTGPSIPVTAGPSYFQSNSIEEWLQCIHYPATYNFVITDTKGNGICCNAGLGFYKISFNGNIVASGGDFYFKTAFSAHLSKIGGNVCCYLQPWLIKGWNLVPSSGCETNEFIFKLEMLTDKNGAQTSWEVVNGSGYSLLLEEQHESDTAYEYQACLPSPGIYFFTIHDTAGDGICCENGYGGYSILANGVALFVGGDFQKLESLRLKATGEGANVSVAIH